MGIVDAIAPRPPGGEPPVGQHTEEILRDVLGYDDAGVARVVG